MKRETEYTRREFRQFGCGLSLLLAVFGGVLCWKGRFWGAAFLGMGPLVFLAFWYELPGVRPFFKGWMVFAGYMSRISTGLLLFLLYLLVLTPTALIARLLGKCFIQRRYDPGCDSYWEEHRETSRESCEKQS